MRFIMRQEDEELFWSKYGLDISDENYEKSDKTIELDNKAEQIIDLLKGENLEDIEYVLETAGYLCKKRAII